MHLQAQLCTLCVHARACDLADSEFNEFVFLCVRFHPCCSPLPCLVNDVDLSLEAEGSLLSVGLLARLVERKFVRFFHRVSVGFSVRRSVRPIGRPSVFLSLGGALRQCDRQSVRLYESGQSLFHGTRCRRRLIVGLSCA